MSALAQFGIVEVMAVIGAELDNNAYEFLLTSVDEKVLCDNVDEENVNLDKEIYSPDRVNYFNDMEDTERMII